MSQLLVSSDEEGGVEWNKADLQKGLRTIHEPGASSLGSQSLDVAICPAFALAKPVETGPCTEPPDTLPLDVDLDHEAAIGPGDVAEGEAPAQVEPGHVEPGSPKPGHVEPASNEDDHESKGAKRQKLLNDPKFKKGTRMGDLSPESQKMLVEVRRLRKIENSDKWHGKFWSKGVTKEDEVPPEKASPEKEPEDDAAGAEVLTRDGYENGDDAPDAPAPDSSKPQTLNDVRVP